MVLDQNTPDQLVSDLLRCKQSLDGLDELLSPSVLTLQDNAQALAAKRKFILDSFAVKAVHSKVQKFESASKQRFVSENVKPYNQKLVHLVRLDAEVKKLQRQLDALKKIMFLPDVSLSALTLRNTLEGKYRCSDKDPDLTAPVLLLEIFSLSPDSELPKPVYADFEELLSVEIKHRLLLQIKYELLLQIKNTLLHSKREWVSRDEHLRSFIDGSLAKILGEIGQVRAAECEGKSAENRHEESSVPPSNDVSGSVSAAVSDDEEAPDAEIPETTDIDMN